MKKLLGVSALLAAMLVMSLASCKKVEIDGDVSMEKTYYEYAGTAEVTFVDETSEKVELGHISYGKGNNSNYTNYCLRFYLNDDREYWFEKIGNDYYFWDHKVTINGNPEGNEFTIVFAENARPSIDFGYEGKNNYKGVKSIKFTRI